MRTLSSPMVPVTAISSAKLQEQSRLADRNLPAEIFQCAVNTNRIPQFRWPDIPEEETDEIKHPQTEIIQPGMFARLFRQQPIEQITYRSEFVPVRPKIRSEEIRRWINRFAPDTPDHNPVYLASEEEVGMPPKRGCWQILTIIFSKREVEIDKKHPACLYAEEMGLQPASLYLVSLLSGLDLAEELGKDFFYAFSSLRVGEKLSGLRINANQYGQHGATRAGSTLKSREISNVEIAQLRGESYGMVFFDPEVNEEKLLKLISKEELRANSN